MATALLRPAATQSDLDLLARAYRALHPGLTRYQSRAAFDARVDSLSQWFALPRGRGESYLALTSLAASIRCSHTYLNFWNQPGATKRWLLEGRDKLPCTFRLAEDDHWIVERSAVIDPADTTAILLRPGDRVLSVNGVATPVIVARLLPYIRGDGDNDGKRRSLIEFRQQKKYQTTDALLPLLLPPEEGHYTLTVRRAGGGDTDTIVVSAVSAVQRDATARPVPGARSPWSFAVNDGVAVLTVDGFSGGEGGRDDEWTPFVQQTFRGLRQDSVRTLIVDLRENEGGADAAAALLLRHLIGEEITLPPLRRYVVYQTVAAELRPYLNTWDDDFYDRRGSTRPVGDGTFDLKSDGDWPARITPAKDAFRGRVLVLTSLVNSSASHIMMRLLARRPGVLVVGEPTGGSLRGSNGGNLFFMQLPGTGFEADIPLIGYDYGAGQPADGVQPDVPTPAGDALTRALELARE